MTPHTIYLVRHGQTEDNLVERLTGQRDSPLTALGESQASANGRLLNELIDRDSCDFVASPLGRARRTMELLRSAMGLPSQNYRTDPRLMEAHFGDWHGRLWSEAKAFRDKSLFADHDDTWHVAWPNGESRAQFYARVCDFLQSIERDTVIVSHGGTVRMLRGALLMLGVDDMFSFEAPNAGVIEISGPRERLHGR